MFSDTGLNIYIILYHYLSDKSKNISGTDFTPEPPSNTALYTDLMICPAAFRSACWLDGNIIRLQETSSRFRPNSRLDTKIYVSLVSISRDQKKQVRGIFRSAIRREK